MEFGIGKRAVLRRSLWNEERKHMKRILVTLCVIFVLLFSAACGNTGTARQTESSSAPDSGVQPGTQPEQSDTKGEDTMLKIEIVIGSKAFSATLYDNETARALAEQLPMTLDMSELNGNEKYYYLEGSLPTDSGRPSGIKAGDIMLFGSNCLVLFYEGFSTSYSYTPLGHIDDPEGLAAALGSDSIQVTFRRAE